MGMLDTTATMPDVDTFGLLEYRVSTLVGEVEPNGKLIRIACGEIKFCRFYWLYTAIFTPEDALRFADQVRDLAMQAFKIAAIAESIASH